jgi:acetyltransferase-like isoleucine patch superfamily enzyme
MLNKLIRLMRFCRKLAGLIIKCFKFCFKFLLPNLRNLSKNRILLSGLPSFNQITLCKGQGIVKIGKKCSFGYKLGGFHRGGSIEIQARYKNSVIKLGDNIAANNNICICAANYIEIGNDTLIGQYVTIMDHEAHGIDPRRRREIGELGKVIVGKNVWIGSNVVVLKNSEIGDNSIIAAGAVVSGKFPENVIIGGVPAKIIKRI